MIASGIGVLRRFNPARYALMAVAIVNVLGECPAFGARATFGLFEPSDALYLVASVLVAAGFATFAFIVLLNGSNAREFAA